MCACTVYVYAHVCTCKSTLHCPLKARQWSVQHQGVVASAGLRDVWQFSDSTALEHNLGERNKKTPTKNKQKTNKGKYICTYRRTGFNCDNPLNANANLFLNSQSLERNPFVTITAMTILRHRIAPRRVVKVVIAWAPAVRYFSFHVSLLRYLKPVNRLPMADEARLSPGVAAEVNKVVEKALHAGGTSNAERPKKRKYTTSFTPEDRAAIGRYAL